MKLGIEESLQEGEIVGAFERVKVGFAEGNAEMITEGLRVYVGFEEGAFEGGLDVTVEGIQEGTAVEVKGVGFEDGLKEDGGKEKI